MVDSHNDDTISEKLVVLVSDDDPLPNLSGSELVRGGREGD